LLGCVLQTNKTFVFWSIHQSIAQSRICAGTYYTTQSNERH
jgi:hypothetical protein